MDWVGRLLLKRNQLRGDETDGAQAPDLLVHAARMLHDEAQHLIRERRYIYRHRRRFGPGPARGPRQGRPKGQQLRY